MGYLIWAIALGIILLFGYWSGSRRRKIERKGAKKDDKVYPLKRGKIQTKLRRVK
jgi:hypothetical protein